MTLLVEISHAQALSVTAELRVLNKKKKKKIQVLYA